MIKVLASPTTQGNTGGDFTWTEPNELVTAESVCPCSDYDCHRAFIGMDTRKGTTVAVVTEIDMTEEEFTERLVASMVKAWGGRDGDESGEIAQAAREAAVDTLEMVYQFEVGTRVIKDPEDGWISAWVDPFAAFA